MIRLAPPTKIYRGPPARTHSKFAVEPIDFVAKRSGFSRMGPCFLKPAFILQTYNVKCTHNTYSCGRVLCPSLVIKRKRWTNEATLGTLALSRHFEPVSWRSDKKRD